MIPRVNGQYSAFFFSSFIASSSAKMSLHSIPNETLTHIVSYLRTRDIEALAQTYNRIITSICLPLLSAWLALAHNERKMIALFGSPIAWDVNGCCEATYASRADELPGTFSLPSSEPVRRLHALDYFDLSGDLYWLQPLDEDTARAMTSYQMGESVFSSKEMKELKDNCQRLGCTLPRGFEQFMTSLELQNRIPSASACYWDYEPLVKLKSTEKAALDGYACKIYSDQQGW
jgi:hypothetical protein